jgi:hypothetical protein
MVVSGVGWAGNVGGARRLDGESFVAQHFFSRHSPSLALNVAVSAVGERHLSMSAKSASPLRN